MQISFSKREGRVPVTLMHLSGDLDASSYTDVIGRAQEAYDEGARDLLIDLTQVPYISSAGLMSLHTIALILSGLSVQSKESGRPAFRSINSKNESVVRQHLKLFNAQPAVGQVLEVVGLSQFLDIHTDLETAIQSF